MNASTTVQSDRVRRHTGETTRQKIDAATRQNISRHATDQESMSRRLAELEREWDIERTLETNASTLALTGAVLGTAVNRKWFWLTGTVLTFLFQHATSGWCPPLPVLRALKVRTQGEIDRERYALKALRGDFAGISPGGLVIEPTLQALEQTENLRQGRREPDRVRRYTSAARLRQLDAEMEQRVRLYASQPSEAISDRIEELRREWGIERYLQINIAAVGLTTLGLAVTKDRRWGYATCAALGMFLFHAVEGFDPPLPLLRARGVRTRAEIDREIYALKILRGDFDDAIAADHSTRIAGTVRAVEL